MQAVGGAREGGRGRSSRDCQLRQKFASFSLAASPSTRLGHGPEVRWRLRMALKMRQALSKNELGSAQLQLPQQQRSLLHATCNRRSNLPLVPSCVCSSIFSLCHAVDCRRCRLSLKNGAQFTRHVASCLPPLPLPLLLLLVVYKLWQCCCSHGASNCCCYVTLLPEMSRLPQV